MERENQHQHSRPPMIAGGGPPPGDELERLRPQLADTLSAADNVLNSLGSLDAELYLQQNRQRGAQ